jgi:hypothetical protein
LYCTAFSEPPSPCPVTRGRTRMVTTSGNTWLVIIGRKKQKRFIMSINYQLPWP